MPTKISVHALDFNPYMHEFLSQFYLIQFFHYIVVVHGPKGREIKQKEIKSMQP